MKILIELILIHEFLNQQNIYIYIYISDKTCTKSNIMNKVIGLVSQFNHKWLLQSVVSQTLMQR